MWSNLSKATLAALAGAVVLGGVAAAAEAPFADVPPWHWAYDAVTKLHDEGIVQGYPTSPTEQAQNSILQVYNGFAHPTASGAREWVERFTYNRPTGWPAPLSHSQIASFSLGGIRVDVRGETAAGSFTATVRARDGSAATTPMNVQLRFNGQDWQVDYATLASASPLFR